MTMKARSVGPVMTSQSLAQLLGKLGMTKSHSWPYTPDDNPFSEAQFKTVKYRPAFPDRFGAIQDARVWARPFFHWYNHQHRHSALALLTPAVVHAGQATALSAQRQVTLRAAYEAHPERFVKGLPQPPALPEAVWINPPVSEEPDASS